MSRFGKITFCEYCGCVGWGVRDGRGKGVNKKGVKGLILSPNVLFHCFSPRWPSPVKLVDWLFAKFHTLWARGNHSAFLGGGFHDDILYHEDYALKIAEILQCIPSLFFVNQSFLASVPLLMIPIFHMNIKVKWQDGTCDGKNPWVGLSWANGTLFSQLWSCVIDSHGNTDEGPSTLYLLLLLLHPLSFYMEMYSIFLSFSEMSSERNGLLGEIVCEKTRAYGTKTLLMKIW